MIDRESMVFIVGDMIAQQMRKCDCLWMADRAARAMQAEGVLEGVRKLAVNLGFDVEYGYNAAPCENGVYLYLWADVEGIRFTVPNERGGFDA